jgi:hypothetical protein
MNTQFQGAIAIAKNMFRLIYPVILRSDKIAERTYTNRYRPKVFRLK